MLAGHCSFYTFYLLLPTVAAQLIEHAAQESILTTCEH